MKFKLFLRTSLLPIILLIISFSLLFIDFFIVNINETEWQFSYITNETIKWEQDSWTNSVNAIFIFSGIPSNWNRSINRVGYYYSLSANYKYGTYFYFFLLLITISVFTFFFILSIIKFIKYYHFESYNEAKKFHQEFKKLIIQKRRNNNVLKKENYLRKLNAEMQNLKDSL
jgi:predicted PurR-regulated permease PerM